MKALKGVMIYIGIVLLSFIVICALVIGFMFMTKTNVFGYYFVRAFENMQTVSGVTLDKGITKVNLTITTNNYGVVVEPINDDTTYSDTTDIALSTDNQYIGFLKDEGVENEEGKIVPNLLPQVDASKTSGKAGELNIEIKIAEPEGLLSISKMSVLRVQVPFKLTAEGAPIEYNLTIKTGNGDIDLQHSEDEHGKFACPLNVKSMNLETSKGNVTFDGLGSVVANEEANNKLELDDLTINTNGGTFDFTNFEYVKVTNKVELKSKKANYLFKKLIACANMDNGVYGGAGGVEVNGTVVKLNADMVICGSDGFIFKTETGALKVKHLLTGRIRVTEIAGNVVIGKPDEGEIIPYENTIFTDSAVVEIDNVVGKVGLFNEFGEVKIGLLSNQATMRTENGNITIQKSGLYWNVSVANSTGSYSANSSIILYSTYGDITVKEYFQDAVIYSKKGKIEANSKYYAEKTDRYYYSDISTKDGKITATTAKNPMKIVASDSANITLTVLDIQKNTKTTKPFNGADMYQAVSKNGTVTVTLPLKPYEVKVTARKVEGSVGATTSFGEEYVKINNGSAENNDPKILIQGNKAVLSCAV